MNTDQVNQQITDTRADVEQFSRSVTNDGSGSIPSGVNMQMLRQQNANNPLNSM